MAVSSKGGGGARLQGFQHWILLRFTILFAWSRPHFGPPGPKLETNWQNIGVGLTPENWKKIAPKHFFKNGPRPKFYFWASFPIFRLVFPIFWKRPKPRVSYFFSYFGPEARNGVCARQAGSQVDLQHVKEHLASIVVGHVPQHHRCALMLRAIHLINVAACFALRCR